METVNLHYDGKFAFSILLAKSCVTGEKHRLKQLLSLLEELFPEQLLIPLGYTSSGVEENFTFYVSPYLSETFHMIKWTFVHT